MLTILFWNVRGGGSHTEHLAELAATALSDSGRRAIEGHLLLCAAEPEKLDHRLVLGALARRLPDTAWRNFGAMNRLSCFTNLPANHIEHTRDTLGAFHLKILRDPALPLNEDELGQPVPYLISLVHLSSPMGKWKPDEHQSHRGRDLREALEACEEDWDCTNSVVIGDFNMDPFSYGMTSSDGLNATMCRKIAKKEARHHGPKGDKITTRFFYNPMWQLRDPLIFGCTLERNIII